MDKTETAFDKKMEVELAKAEKYYRAGKGPANEVILKQLRDSGLIVYGAQAINQHLPDWLDKETTDWDIFSLTPEKTAKKLEKVLDKKYGGDYFLVKPAKHPGTYKVMNVVTNVEIADISIPERTVSYKTLDGVNYTTLEHQIGDIKKALADPAAKFRWAKDAEKLIRIRIYRRLHPKKNKVRRLKVEPKPKPAIIIPITSEFKGFKRLR